MLNKNILRTLMIVLFMSFFHSSIIAEPEPKIALKVLEKKNLAKGVVYKNLLIGSKELKLSVHVIEADISRKDIEPVILKGGGLSSELEKLHSMIDNYNEKKQGEVLGAINGNFWAYFYNYPIGPTIINGEVVELNKYREWTSGFFDKKGELYIDNFTLDATLKDAKGKKYTIHKVNRRHSSKGVALFNSYGGDTIPYVTTNMLKRAFDNALEDSTYRDITDSEFDTTDFKSNLFNMKRDSAVDFSLPKVVCRYISKPAVNKDISMLVISVDTGLVAVPEDGCVISFGTEYDIRKLPQKGDKITLRYSTNKYKKKVFYNSVCGTPRLVRNGRSRHEAANEGVKSKTFVEGELPRSAIGTSKDRKKLYLVSIEGTNHEKGIKGSTLENLAYVMRRIGAYQAMNLDGGGSAVMVIDNKNVLWKSRPERSRSLSIGVGILKKD